MQLAHARDDGLTRFAVRIGAEGRILLGELGESCGQLFLTCLRLGLNRNLDDGLGELHGLHKQGPSLACEGLTRYGIAKADECDDIACVGFFDLGAAVGMHEEYLGYPLTLRFIAVQHDLPHLDSSRIHPAECELSDI